MIDEKLKQEFIEKFSEEAFEDLLSKKDSFKNKDFNAVLQWYLKYQKPETIGIVKQQQEALDYFEIDNGILIGFKDKYKNNYPEKIIIPGTVKGISDWAFFGCIRLTSVTIPNSVTSIGNYAFYGCTDLTSITYQGTKTQWNSIKKGFNWNNNTGNYTIYCTDGDIAK